MKRIRDYSFLLSALLTSSIWALSPLLTGRAEPWDADGFFYIGALAATGLLAGALIPKRLFMHYLADDAESPRQAIV